MQLIVLLREYHCTHTYGTFVLPSGETIRTIERPWLNNKRNVSCYPEGVYIAKYIDRSASGKYKRVWHIQDVPERGGILWHVGNLVRHSRGCTLPGLRVGKLGGKSAVLFSGAAMNVIRREIGPNDFVLLVKEK